MRTGHRAGLLHALAVLLLLLLLLYGFALALVALLLLAVLLVTYLLLLHLLLHLLLLLLHLLLLLPLILLLLFRGAARHLMRRASAPRMNALQPAATWLAGFGPRRAPVGSVAGFLMRS